MGSNPELAEIKLTQAQKVSILSKTKNWQGLIHDQDEFVDTRKKFSWMKQKRKRSISPCASYNSTMIDFFVVIERVIQSPGS